MDTPSFSDEADALSPQVRTGSIPVAEYWGNYHPWQRARQALI